MSDSIDISDLDPADVLAALYNASRPQGMGFLDYNPAPMTHDEAQDLLSRKTYFDYLLGRVMKVKIENPINPWGYDRDNGAGAAAVAILALRTGRNEILNAMHEDGKRNAAREVKEHINDPTIIQDDGSIRLGLNDVAETLNRAVDRSLQE